MENVENVQETQNIEKEQKAIQRTDLNLNYNHRVCHLHFLEKDIERKIVLKDRNGRIIQEVLYILLLLLPLLLLNLENKYLKNLNIRRNCIRIHN